MPEEPAVPREGRGRQREAKAELRRAATHVQMDTKMGHVQKASEGRIGKATMLQECQQTKKL